ncbi:ElyC/SanA/YdcF family protein [Curtobacterium citreum]|uniref:ElyC/SanA/YdcF family protein n=1 Tax=Curtobacterium citreum TaxID=2036 RepID=UPI00254D3E20|nr:ElyC/SanA/YdcF family protein [Curtobacterium citreum]MDK8171654.1 ElyC/SanA/YdcF family protein [Curtobacterium citreum]
MVLLSCLAWGEAAHFGAGAASRRRRARHSPTGRDIAIVLLGFANRGAHPNLVNRWRARIAVRTARLLVRRGARSVRVICCGGPTKGPVPEAELLAVALRHAGWHGETVLERHSRSTWENINNVRPLLRPDELIAICSNDLRAVKARVYFARQDPSVVERLTIAANYCVGEMVLVKPLFAAVGLRKLRTLGTHHR